jgi:hypothetical protein
VIGTITCTPVGCLTLKIPHVVHTLYNCVLHVILTIMSEYFSTEQQLVGSVVKEHCAIRDMKIETSQIRSINFSLQWANHHLFLFLNYQSEFLFLVAADSLSVPPPPPPKKYVLKVRCYSSTMPTDWQ